MAVLESLLSGFRKSRATQRRSRLQNARQTQSEALEERLLLTNPDPLSSNPGALKTIYLDFDGHVENAGAWANQAVNNRTVDTVPFSLDNNTAAFSQTERTVIEEIFLRVREDFAIYDDINITTVPPPNFNPGEALLVSIGGFGFNPDANNPNADDWWSPRRFNHALPNGFTNTTNSSTTVFVFARDYQSHPATIPSGRNGQIGRDIANGVSEAVGIAMGLGERIDPNDGDIEASALLSDDPHAEGLRDVWFNTPLPNGAAQDDIDIITSAPNDIDPIPDDHGDSITTATAFPITGNQEMLSGIIGHNGDSDFFAFSTSATTATFTVSGLNLATRDSALFGTPFSNVGVTNAGSNLDPVLQLLDANGVVIATDDQPFVINDNNSLTATISASLPAGNYYLEVNGGSTYGSLGEYEILIDDVDAPFALGAPPRQSNPAADFTFFLDFNGHVVANDEIVSQRADMINQPFYVPVYDTDGDRTSFSPQEQLEIVEIYERVAEDLAPFDVNVTTFDPFVYDNRQAVLVAIGGDGTWLGPVGTVGTGFAELNTFSSGTGDNNAVVFSDNFSSPKETALEATAAIGLTLGIETYLEFVGGVATGNRAPGDPAVGPIGGDSVNSLRDTFLQGEGSMPGAFQDPLSIINSTTNTIPYRPDDHGNVFNTATILNVTTDDEIQTGIIEENGDEDWFSFQTLAADATISVTGLDLTVDALGNPTGVANPGANLDPVLQLFRDVDGNGNLVLLASDGDFPATLDLTDNNPASLKASFNLMIQEGLYYIRVATRPNEYGNLGQYTITMEGVDGTPAVISFRPDPNDPTVNSISENAGLVPGIGRIDRPFGQPASAPLVVDLVSTDLTELMVPPQVTIPPGQDFVTFDVTAVDDDILDGDQNVLVEAYVDGVRNSTAILKVADHETIKATVNPNPVRENAGPAGATLTVVRSNTDIQAANHWISSGSILQERDPNGNVLRTIPAEWPVGVRPVLDVVHDVQVLQNGNIALYNGTGQAFISVYNVTTASWQHFSLSGLSAGNALDPTNGGLTSIGDFIFLTDVESFEDDPRGIVRVNTVTGQIDRFADSSIGSRLFILSGSSVFEIDAVTGDILNTIDPQATLGIFNSLEAIAFDGTSLWVLFDRAGGIGTGGVHELQKINPDTGVVEEVHSIPLPGSIFGIFSDEIGMTALNGLLYFNIPFDSLTTAADRAFQAYNTSNRQFEGGLVPFEALNDIFASSSIGALKGDGTAANPDVLLIHGEPDSIGIFDDRIYLIDPTTGRAVSSFSTGTSLSFLFDAGLGSLDDVSIDGVPRDGLIYLNLDTGLQVFDRSGALVDVDPTTVVVDQVPHAIPFGFQYAKIGGADVPGVTAQELSFRDVTVGITDNLLYGLVENGSQVTVYDPNTLVFQRNIQLDAVVNAISVDEEGNILGGGPNGGVRYFDANGNTIAVLDTSSLGLAAVADVETNISEEVIISDTNGVVVIGPRTAVMTNNAGLLQIDAATTATTTYVSFGRHPKLPTGPLVVTITSDDVTELQTPVEVKIPVGQTSATVPLDVIDDDELDGPQIVNITGDAPNYVPDAAQVTVLDAESVAVEVRSPVKITVRDVSQVGDGDRLTIKVNDKTTVFEIEDTSVGNGIATSSNFSISVDLSTAITNDDLAAAIASAISLSAIPVTVSANGNVVCLDGNPNFPSAAALLGVDGAISVEKPVAETAGLLSSGVRVFRTDLGGPFTVPASTTGKNNESQEIEDNDVILSRITIPEQVSVVTDINVTITLQHEFLPDIDAYLVSPNGTRVELFTDLGSNEFHLTDTVFDDEAATRIIDGDAPFTGRFIPEQALSTFDGEDPSGVWTLEITDDNVSDTGTLISWCLDIETRGISETQLTLITTDTSEATITSQTVTIPAARSEVFVDLSVIDDTLVDGSIPVTVQVDSANVAALFDLGSDVIDVTDVENLSLSLDTLIVSEGDGPGVIMGMVTRSDSLMTDPLTVNLASSDTTELDVAPTVTIPAGQPSAMFLVDAVDDLDFDGDQMVTISASADGYVPETSEVVTVVDQEPRLVMTTLQSSVPEDVGTITVTLARIDALDLSLPQQVVLTSSDLTELTVPTNFVIGIGAISTSFTATILEDSILDGSQTVTITASDPNVANPTINTGTLDIVVEDAEAVSITVAAGDESFRENAGAAAAIATVSLSTDNNHTQDVVVNLTNSDPTAISIPPQVTIPVGVNSVTFQIDAVNDDVLDGDQPVSITGTTAGYRDGVLDLTVVDHEPPVFDGPPAVTEDPTPTFSWGALVGATRYDLWVNNVTLGISQLFRLDNIPGDVTSFTPEQALGIGTYRAWVRAYDSLERPADWSPGLNIRIRTRPVITSPINKAIIAETSFPEISWSTVVDTPLYDLWVNNLTTGESQVIREENLPTTSLSSAAANLPGGTYKAWVRAKAPDGLTGFWSLPVVFTVLAAPQITGLAGATFDRTPTIEWNPVVGAENYYIWLTKRNPGEAAEVVLRDRFVTDTHRIPDTDLADGRYAVWLKSIAADGTESAWSPATQFFVGAGGRPTITAPAAGSTTSALPVFLWVGIDQADHYEFWMNRIDVPQSQVIYNPNVKVTSLAAQTALASGRYRAWVRGVSDMGEKSSWSRPVDFFVQTSPVDSESDALPDINEILLASMDSTSDVQTSGRYVVTPLIDDEARPTPAVSSTNVVREERPDVNPAEDASDEVQEESVDAVMSEWVDADWWATRATSEEESEPKGAALGLGLLAAGSVLRNRDRKRGRARTE